MSPEKEPQPKFIIETMSLNDVVAANEMRLEVWLDTYVNDSIGVTRLWIEEHNRVQMAPEKNEIRRNRLRDTVNHAGWVAKDSSGRIVGSTTPFIHEDGRQDIGSLYVRKEWQGKGIAAALIQKDIEWFDSTIPIELGVATYNERAKAFYRKWGFEEIPGSEELFDNKIPEIKMVRKGDSNEF
jgi:GNAT superfamily N-acetyltransferase